ncbi:MAG: hypothetical protein JXA69_13670 [Phycisphaerae bacterium]|nr:hypothetical protein [Phycisphaerae bacterium]
MQFCLCSEERGFRTVVRYVAVSTIAATWVLAAGCGHPLESGYSDQGKLQLQFFSPPGATVAVDGGPTRSHQINTYGNDGHRLEHTPEEFCVFNLSPGTYEFKYTAAEGLSDVSVYGELKVQSSWHSYAKDFMRRSFIPISLPSAYFKQVSADGNEIFPYRGEAHRTAIDENDLMRLKQGDIVEKVFFVADLEKADKTVKKCRQDLVVLDRKLEYAEARFRRAYAEFRLATDDPMARLLRQDREFIGWEKERLELQQKIEDTNAKLKRTEAILRGDHVLIRRGALVVATEEVIQPHRDAVGAADDVGEVLLVMRIGGRHMHWGEPARELASFNP